MKKLFAFVFSLFIALGAFAFDSLSDLNISKEMLSDYAELKAIPDRFPESAFAYKHSTIDMKLTLISWDYSAAGQVPLDLDAPDSEWMPYLKGGWAESTKDGSAKQPSCQMVKISNNWLIGDSHCLPEYIRENAKNINAVPSKKEQFQLQEFKKMKKGVYEIENNEARIDGHRIDTANHLFIGKDVMLLYVPDEVVAACESFYMLKMANIRVSSNPTDMEDKTIYINEKGVTGYTIRDNQIEVPSRSVGGTPAFYTYAKDKTNPNRKESFLIGFNSAERSKKGKAFKLITEDMEKFIIQSVNTHTPDEWNFVLKKKVVHDSYFE